MGDLLGFFKESPDAFNSLIQTWLYFGLLHEFFGPRLQSQDFVLNGASAHRLITTTALPGYCDDWLQDNLTSSPEAQRERITQLSKSIEFGVTLSNELDRYFCSTDTISVIIFSVRVLTDSLKIMLKRFSEPEKTRVRLRSTISLTNPYAMDMYLRQKSQPKTFHSPCANIEPSIFLLDHMRQTGWCPSRLSGSSHSLSTVPLFYLTGLPHGSVIGEGHTYCTTTACRVDNLEGYVVQHDGKCSHRECRLYQASMNKLVIIYGKNDTPVILCATDESSG